jgi:putative SOS response-associated peptidase YedK
MPSSQFALMEATKKRATKLEAKGKSVDFKELLRMEPDGGTTNIRNVKSKHRMRWLGAENRCVVPFTSFREFNKAEGGDIWFALEDSPPLACFAGIWTNWTSVRKVPCRHWLVRHDDRDFFDRPLFDDRRARQSARRINKMHQIISEPYGWLRRGGSLRHSTSDSR